LDKANTKIDCLEKATLTHILEHLKNYYEGAKDKSSGLEKMNKKLLSELEELEALLATEEGGIAKLCKFISKLESDQKQLQRDVDSEKDTVASLENQNRNLGG